MPQTQVALTALDAGEFVASTQVASVYLEATSPAQSTQIASVFLEALVAQPTVKTQIASVSLTVDPAISGGNTQVARLSLYVSDMEGATLVASVRLEVGTEEFSWHNGDDWELVTMYYFTGTSWVLIA